MHHLTLHLSSFLFPHLEHLGVWGYWVAFLFAFLESLAFVGTIIPGSTAIVLMGFMASLGYWDIGDLIWFASVGAILGDFLSYWLGVKGVRFFKDENKYLKASHLKAGEEFFGRYGGKSVFLGRFLAPIRSVVPFVAGLSGMDLKKFVAWNILGGVCWSLLHLFLGYFSGRAVGLVERTAHRAEIALTVLALIGFALYILHRSRIGEKGKK